jgi:hypothetical protein
MGLLRALVQAQREWARAGVPCDLVVLSHEAHSYHMSLQHELTLMTEQPGGSPALGTPAVSTLHRLRFDQISPAQLATLQGLARVHLVADGRPLPAQVGAWSERHATPPASAWKARSPRRCRCADWRPVRTRPAAASVRTGGISASPSVPPSGRHGPGSTCSPTPASAPS